MAAEMFMSNAGKPRQLPTRYAVQNMSVKISQEALDTFHWLAPVLPGNQTAH
jgi:hypothetical protein